MNEKKPKREKVQKPKKQKKPMNPKLKAFLIVILSLALTAVLTLTITGGYFLKFVSSYVNGEIKININEYKENQAQTTIIYAYDENNEVIELTRLHGEQNRVWIGLNEIPENLQKAYIALEDKRFKEHSGVDWLRTVKATVTMGEAGGGSTITQQLIKNLTGDNSKTVSRKFYEILNALNLEKNASKDTILEAYLNTVYMSHGCYGVKTASEKYFGKQVSDLNIAECACLAAITKHPSQNDPLIHPDENRKRQMTCLDNMLEEGVITQEEYNEAKAYKMVFTNSENYVKDETKKDEEDENNQENVQNEVNSYYVDFIIEQVIQDLVDELGYSRAQASKYIYNGGLRIYSAVDLAIQAELEDVYVNRISMPKYNKNIPDAQSAMTIMDYSGRVVGIVGGVGEKTTNRELNRASSSPRQPGSSIKPLSVYAPGINEGYITYGTLVQNYGFMVNGKLWPHNYGGDPGSPGSYITVQRAIAVSYNTVPAQLVRKMGVNLCYNYLENNFHLKHLAERDKAYAPLAVGGLTYGVTTLEMASAFACFGNGGKYYKPYSYFKITNASGTKIILQNDNKQPEQAITSESADVMNKLLQTVVTDAAHLSTGRNYGIEGFQTFAKTGTTTEDKDRWFVGGTPYYVAAVWFGCDKPKQISNYVTGNPAGAIFDTVMTRIHKGLEVKEFELHSDNVISARYCLGSGKLANSYCGSTALGWYDKNNMPGYCNGREFAGEPITDENGNIVTTTSANAGEEESTQASGGETTTGENQTPITVPTTMPATIPTPIPEPEPTPTPPDPSDE